MGKSKNGNPEKIAGKAVVARSQGTVLEGKIQVVRGELVILAPDLAEFYGTTTRAVNQYRDRNQDRFENFAFELSDEEFDLLRSQNVISKSTKYRPWAYTEHGVAMMSMGMKSDNAVSLSRVIIDTFVSFRRGTLPTERVLPGPDAAAQRRKLQTMIYDQMEALLETRLQNGDDQTVGEKLGSIASSALEHVKSVLDAQGKKNEKISAEVAKIIAEAEKVYAEVRKIHAEAESLNLQNLRTRLQILTEFRVMLVQLERDDWLGTFDAGFDTSKRIASPTKKRLTNETDTPID